MIELTLRINPWVKTKIRDAEVLLRKVELGPVGDATLERQVALSQNQIDTQRFHLKHHQTGHAITEMVEEALKRLDVEPEEVTP